MRLNRAAILVFALLLSGLVRAQVADGLQQANAWYQQGNYDQARQGYEALLAQGPRVNVLHNLGNACYRAGEVGWAIVYYEQALLAAPRDRDLRANLVTALAARRSPAGDRVPGWSAVVVQAIVSRFTLSELVVAAAVPYFAGASLVFLWLRNGHLRRRQRWLCYGLIMLTVAFSGLALVRAGTYHDPARVALVCDTALLNGPADNFPTIRRAYAGEEGRTISQQGVWREIKLESGAQGWVMQSSLASLLPGHL